MNKMVSKLVVGLMLGAFVATSGMVLPIALAEETNTQQNEKQVPPPADSNNQSNEHSGHH